MAGKITVEVIASAPAKVDYLGEVNIESQFGVAYVPFPCGFIGGLFPFDPR